MCQASKLSNWVISTVKCNSSLVCILREGTDSFFELKQIERSAQASAYFVLALSRYRIKGLIWRLANLKKGKIKLTLLHPSTNYFDAFRATSREQQTPQIWMKRRGEGCGLVCSPKREVLTIFSPIVATMVQVSILCGEELGPDLYGMCPQFDCPVH